MKNILCFGDSNTYGYVPQTGNRYERDVRWTGVVQRELGDGYYVIEEGLNGRTTVWEDPIEEFKSGKDYLLPCLASHKPLDLVVIMLGTNDLKVRFSLSALDIAGGMENLLRKILKSDCFRENEKPQILLMAPVPLGNMTEFFDMFGPDANKKSVDIVPLYKNLAQTYHTHFLEAGSIIRVSNEDGLHYSPESHNTLGQAVAKIVADVV